MYVVWISVRDLRMSYASVERYVLTVAPCIRDKVLQGISSVYTFVLQTEPSFCLATHGIPSTYVK